MRNSRHSGSDRPKCFYVYIMASKNRVLYIGVTNSAAKRVWQHKFGDIEGFTHNYKVNRLVHWESFDDVRHAIAREKELKGWTRAKKVALVGETNPKWKDLAENWYRRRTDEERSKEFTKRNPIVRGVRGETDLLSRGSRPGPRSFAAEAAQDDRDQNNL